MQNDAGNTMSQMPGTHADERPGGFNAGHIIWEDQFDGSGLPDNDMWEIILWEPGRVNQEAQKYTDRVENLRCEDGVLIIEARNDNWNGYPITSGRIESYARWAPPSDGSRCYRMEIRAILAGGGGSWPAFWLLGNRTYGGWPVCGEIDILEYVGNDGYFQANVHAKVYPENSIGETTPDDPENTWHIYALNFYADRLEFYVDDALFHTVARPAKPDNLNWPFHDDEGNGFSMIINTAVGGMMGGEINDDDFPMVMKVEYARVYERSCGCE